MAKSLIEISRERAIELIFSRLESLNNEEISDLLSNIGYGEIIDLPYYDNYFKVNSDRKRNGGNIYY